MDAKEKAVITAMKKAGKPVRPGDIAEAAKLDKDEVTKILKKLKIDGLVASPVRCFYEPV